MGDLNETIWYIEATPASGWDKSEGSAVAVRLRKVGAPKSAKTYLLTCGHVVRGRSKDRHDGYGPLLANIRAWPPDTGFGDDQAKEVKVDLAMKDFPERELNQDERINAADDWVVLEILDSQAATAADAVAHWAGDDLSGEFLIYGFFGGASSFRRGIVAPRRMPTAFPFHYEDVGCVYLTGEGTKPGLSGGGVFGKTNLEFAGIHRARFDDRLQLCAVSSRHIRARLRESGYEPVPYEPVLNSGPQLLQEPLRKLLKLLEEVPELGKDWRQAFTRALPVSSLLQLPAASDDATPLRSVLEELALLGTDQEDVYPLFRFIYELSYGQNLAGQLKARLATWLDTHCPAEQREQLGKSRSLEARGEPRIVIHMTRPEKDSEKTPAGSANSPSPVNEEHYCLKTWFLGFPRTPQFPDRVGSREEFKKVLEDAWKEVIGQHDPKFVWVELFLPKEMYSWPVEKEKILIPPFEQPVLGARHRFVLRSNRGPYGPQLETRWNRTLKSSEKTSQPVRLNCCLPLDEISEEEESEDPDDVKNEHYMVELRGDLDPDEVKELFYDLESKTSVLGVLWSSPPAAEIGDEDVWDAVIASGVPLIMWLREPPPEPGNHADPKTLFHQKKWDNLASEVQRIRLDAARRREVPWHLGRHLAVLLDDPRRPLPLAGRGAQLQSPASDR